MIISELFDNSPIFVPCDDKYLSKVDSLKSTTIIFDLEDSIKDDKKQNALESLLRFLDTYKGSKKIWVRINNDRMDIEISELKDKNIVGFIDLILRDKSDGKYIIADHKSKKLKKGKRGSKSSDELDASLRQLYLYSEYIKQEYGEYPKELWFNSFRLDENNLIKCLFYKEKFDETMEWVEKTIQEISNNEEWTPTCDYFYCKYLCDCSSECEYYEMMRG